MRVLLCTLHSKYIHPSLALPCLAAHGKAHGPKEADFFIREFRVQEPWEQILSDILEQTPDIVAFSVYIWNRQATLDLCRVLKIARPNLRIVLGGPEISFEKADFFEAHPSIDALIRGEGEGPFVALMHAWAADKPASNIARICIRQGGEIHEGPDGPQLADLDSLPSPHALGLVDLSKDIVYLETSRGCPYSCIFCMSALDRRVRSFSMGRIRSDLQLLMEAGVRQIKLVDRTFNYDAKRAREIFRFILEHNRHSSFHFEIGAHLLDDETIRLLAKAPQGMFQFEIGVQSSLPSTLRSIERHLPMEPLLENVRRLRAETCVHLHLDLIAGLPGENVQQVLDSIDRVLELRPHHLQLETVKVLPGSPLRNRAQELGIRFAPFPPYAALCTPEASYQDLEKLRRLGRLLDLVQATGPFTHFIEALAHCFGSYSLGLLRLETFWSRHSLFRHPMGRQEIFRWLGHFCREGGDAQADLLTEHLVRDYCLCEKVLENRLPEFFPALLKSESLTPKAGARMDEVLESLREEGLRLSWVVVPYNRLSEGQGTVAALYVCCQRSAATPRFIETFLPNA